MIGTRRLWEPRRENLIQNFGRVKRRLPRCDFPIATHLLKTLHCLNNLSPTFFFILISHNSLKRNLYSRNIGPVPVTQHISTLLPPQLCSCPLALAMICLILEVYGSCWIGIMSSPYPPMSSSSMSTVPGTQCLLTDGLLSTFSFHCGLNLVPTDSG